VLIFRGAGPLAVPDRSLSAYINFNETSFLMSMISTAKIVTGSESRGWPKAIQPED